MRQPEASMYRPSLFISDRNPYGARETLVYHLRDGSDVGVDVCCYNKRGVDIRDPDFYQRAVQSREDERSCVEEESTRITGNY
jgi:hypothetical protein